MSKAIDPSEHVQRISRLPCWNTAVDVSPLEGGITNHNYLVSTNAKKYVVRLGCDIPEHQILRFNEIAAGKAAALAGISPEIIFHDEGVLVMDFVSGHALNAGHIQEQTRLGEIVKLLRTCHQDVPKHLRGASVVFWVFHIVRDYAATLSEGGSTHMQLLPSLLKNTETLEQAATPFDIVFGHNDLLPANIMDDGNRLWLIDWEYGGFNTPLFDLGGLASNSELEEPLERWMLEQYYQETLNDELWFRYQAMKCASLLRETMWSMVSEIHSSLDFDYAAYTDENLARFNQSFANFKRL
ncbi:MAG: phosphotransferase [Granulosicoccus sp.]